MQTHLPDTLCYLNGEYQPLNEAKVSVLDRGFIFGDGIYEVVPVYGKKLFRFEEHLARLGRSLAKLRIANPHGRDQWLERCRKLIAALAERSGATDQLVYIQVTRGVALRDHVMPSGIEPTVFMMANAMKPASRRPAPPRRRLHHRARLPLGARRHQVDLAARQRAGAADVGRPRRGRDDHVPQRLSDRGVGVERLGRP